MRTQRRLAVAAATILLLGATSFAFADGAVQINGGAVGGYLHTKMFGDYGPLYVLTGKPTPRYVNGKRVVPQDGWFSNSMRNMANRVHDRDGKSRNGEASPREFTRLSLDNLLIDVPNGVWEQRPPKWRENNSLLLFRENPRVFVSVAVNRVGVEATETNSSLVAKSQEDIGNQLTNVEILPGVHELSGPNLAGLGYNASSTTKSGKQLHYSVWCATRNGYNYTLAVYGELAHQQAIDGTMQAFVGRMRQKEPQRVAQANQPKRRRGWW